MSHYRCYRNFIPHTKGNVHAETVEFFPHNFDMPKTSSADAASHAARDLIKALQNPSPASPLSLKNDHLQALQTLAEIFDTAHHVPNSPSPILTRPVTITTPRIPKRRNPARMLVPAPSNPQTTTHPTTLPTTPPTSPEPPVASPPRVQPSIPLPTSLPPLQPKLIPPCSNSVGGATAINIINT